MKNPLGKILLFVLILVLLAGSLVFVFSVAVPDQFSQTYQRVLSTQYDYYQSLEGEKLVFIGGSDLAFGLDLNLMESLSGKQCALLGNYNAFGPLFPLELSKENLQRGDIVIIERGGLSVDYVDGEVLLTAIGKNFDMYKHLNGNQLAHMAIAYPSVVKKEIIYLFRGGYSPTDIYGAPSFDARGNMIAERGIVFSPDVSSEAVRAHTGTADYSNPEDRIPPDYIQMMNDYIAYCSSIGVSVFITVPTMIADSVIQSDELIDSYDDYLGSKLHAPLISRSKDYILPRELCYDGSHANTEGARYRTEHLYQDLRPYLKETNPS